MFNNQFIFSKIKFLLFFLQKKYFLNLNHVWDRVGDTRYPTGTGCVGYRVREYVGESG